MELKSPEKLETQTYKVRIEYDKPIRIVYILETTGSHTIPPETHSELIQFQQGLGYEMEAYSKRWFSKSIACISFLRLLSQTWEFGTFQPYTGTLPEGGIPLYIEQQWRPDWLEVLPRGYRLHWVLEAVEYGVDPDAKPDISGLPVAGVELGAGAQPAINDEVDIPFQETNEIFTVRSKARERAKQKVRAARLRATLAKWRAEELALRYYERYGEQESLDDQGSALSTDSESDREDSEPAQTA